MSQSIYEAVKKATVAIVISQPERLPAKPFTIIGSGFCIHPSGIVVTCEHVFKAFINPECYAKLMNSVNKGEEAKLSDMGGIVPHAVFYSHVQGHEVVMNPVPIINAVTKTDFDLAAFKLQRHPAYINGYPTLPVAGYNELHEMMEIGTCGYPLGDELLSVRGAVTSSFTKGIISSIVPAPGVAVKDVRRFQLDLTATHGNSGGPVFSLSTGRVFGVLQGGINHPHTRQVLQGISYAEPIYPLFEHDLIERLAKGLTLPEPAL